MCGGLARWLRAIGYDTTFSADIDDAELVDLARRQGRTVISSDSKLFERKLLASGQLPNLFLPRGLKLMDQVRYVVGTLALAVGEPRCMKCNGQLLRASREEVAHLVPARSLIWADTFFLCDTCGQAFWNGSHWHKITARRNELARLVARPRPGPQDQG